MPVPKLLKIELTDRCNAACLFCNRDPGNIDNGIMDFEVFKGIIDEFPETPEVSPQFYGEPMLHPQFFEALEFLQSRKKKITFYTNGSLLNTQGRCERVARAAPWKVIFSIEADNKVDYEALRPGLKWESVLRNIKQFQAVRSPKTTQTIIRMCVTAENRKRIKEVARFWGGIVDKVTQVNEIPSGRCPEGKYKVTKCRRPWEQLVVKWNGNVVLCCIDYFGGVVMGNAKDPGGVRGIWNGERFREARARIARGEFYEVCRSCGFMFVSGKE